jgi:lauroyl/myristoyl acyltransferase
MDLTDSAGQSMRISEYKGHWKSALSFPIALPDVRETVKLAGMALVSWLLPVDELSSAARKIRRMRGERANGSHRINLIVARVLSDYISRQRADEIDVDWRARTLEARMQILALHRPGRSWQPKIQIHGLEHLRAALGAKSGAILWVSDFVYSSLITKMAFCQAGYGVSHLTRPQHGFSVTRYGVRVLNPLWTKIEDRFIAERVTIDKENADTVLELLRSRLTANRVVSITVGNWARRTLDLPFFKGAIRLATGPAHLSQACHAPFLPVFTFRSDSGEYHVSIGSAIDGQTTSQGDYARTIRSYVKTLEEYVLRYPDQWNGWMRHVRREGSELEQFEKGSV